MTGKKEEEEDQEQEVSFSNMGSITSENLDKEIDIDDPIMHSITFGTPSSWPNSICWSLDDRISVITNNCIYILKISSSNKRKKHGSPLGMQVEHSYIPNKKTEVYDTEIELQLSNLSKIPKNNLNLQQQILFDRALVWRTDTLSQNDSYCDVKWSPLGCASDGRSVLATLTASGVVRIHICAPVTGMWYDCIDITSLLHKYLQSHSWFTPKDETDNEKDSLDSGPRFKEISHCKRILFSTVICWGSSLLHCHSCLSNNLFDNIYYTSYFVNYAKCKHAKSPLVTASKSGYMFVWLVTFNMEDETMHNAEVILYWTLEVSNPVSMSWHQITTDEALVAVGFANGLIRIYRLSFEVCSDGSYKCQHVQTLGVWNEVDCISVSFACWILPMDSVLRLVASKGTDIIIITVHKDEGGELVCISCELGPSCHASPITSLQCISHKYVLSSSRASTQYFDIENETVHLCENNILRGFKCFGVTSASNMTMLARVCCPNRLLLQQNSYVKQMEVSFLPFLSTDFIAERLVDESIHLDICVREYITICSAEHFILPQGLHKYCAEPEGYDISLHKLQMYLYFNQLRYMQQSGQRVSSLTREEVDSDAVSEEFNDPVTMKIERAIAIRFYSEMLSKCLQLLENGWVKETRSSVLALLLMADWLCQVDESADAFSLPLQCFSLLRETKSSSALKELMEKLKLEKSKKKELLQEEDAVNDEKEDVKEANTKIENTTNKTETETETEMETETSINSNQTEFSRDWEIPREKCPFCDVDASLRSVKNLTCINGHIYFRCCLTLRTSMNGCYRKCVGCGRTASSKCFDSELNIDSVLLNIDLCPFCGCRFIDYNR